MAGSISLAGLACIYSGAGLTSLAVPDRCLETVASFSPCYMTIPVPDELGMMASNAWSTISPLLDRFDCVGVGPGIGRSQQVGQLVRRLYQEATVPMIVDADGLFALAQEPSSLSSHAGPRILTPHPGEFEKLSGVAASNRSSQIAAAIELARQSDTVIVLKGNRTLVTDGHNSYYNESGNPGMATGGSGDCLTGMLVALVCQGLGPLDASRLGVYLHGLAGDLAQIRLGGRVVPPNELIQEIPLAFSRLS